MNNMKITIEINNFSFNFKCDYVNISYYITDNKKALNIKSLISTQLNF